MTPAPIRQISVCRCHMLYCVCIYLQYIVRLFVICW